MLGSLTSCLEKITEVCKAFADHDNLTGISLEDQRMLEKVGLIYQHYGYHLLPLPLLLTLLPQVNKVIIQACLLPIPGRLFCWDHLVALEARLRFVSHHDEISPTVCRL